MRWFLRLLPRDALVAELRRRKLAVLTISREETERFYEARNREHPQHPAPPEQRVCVPDFTWAIDRIGIEAQAVRAAYIAMAYCQDNDRGGVELP